MALPCFAFAGLTARSTKKISPRFASPLTKGDRGIRYVNY